ncbi:hypothetical protein AGR4B_Lc10057 [Agrobacterium tumefaciens str. CFBP 5621]|nr:hypothetical protein AGR4B_Lc10057 [Agrobacterium tumefaciens str. CFBP 5621]
MLDGFDLIWHDKLALRDNRTGKFGLNRPSADSEHE